MNMSGKYEYGEGEILLKYGCKDDDIEIWQWNGEMKCWAWVK